MDLVAGYGSEDSSPSDGDQKEVDSRPKLMASFVAPKVNAAPSVLSMGVKARSVSNPLVVSSNILGLRNKSGAAEAQIMVHNPRAEAFLSPMQGPAHPHRRDLPVPAGGRATGTGGVIEQASVEDWSFHEQYHTFHQFGYAVDTSGKTVGDVSAHSKRQGDSILTAGVGDLRRKRKKDGNDCGAGDEAGATATRIGAGKGKDTSSLEDLGDPDTDGIWAPDKEPKEKTDLEAGTMTEAQIKFREEWEAEQAKKNREYNMEEDHDRRDERKISHLLPPRHNRDTTAPDTKSTFHGKAKQDYQGKSWMAPPAGARPGDGEHKCFTPKKCIHRWTGHTKGVQAISFFPGYGHLLLSGSMDSTVKMWDVNKGRGQRRTYRGHSAAVRDVAFSNDGHQFLSAGYDRFVRLWDTESGQCRSTFTNRKMPYCVKYYPVDNNIFLAGCSDNRVVQYDVRSGEVVQEYNHHLGPVNSVLFVDDDQRFVSTSDDKKVLIWEYNIPVPIKYISEPDMHSMPTTALHPSGGFWVGQSLDNKIISWTGRDKFRQLRKKVFKGHVNAGYACRIAFSPNGKFLASGDGQGKVYIWDWGSTKVYRKLQCHDDGPCIDVAWHPLQPSWVATAGWDGVIKLWD
ncbi:unnamed protein product [Discosporangium mesarthrocarpum]